MCVYTCAHACADQFRVHLTEKRLMTFLEGSVKENLPLVSSFLDSLSAFLNGSGIHTAIAVQLQVYEVNEAAFSLNVDKLWLREAMDYSQMIIGLLPLCFLPPSRVPSGLNLCDFHPRCKNYSANACLCPSDVVKAANVEIDP